MKKSIEDLNESKEFQRPTNRARKGVLLTELSSDFAEVYSPPRVTKLASDMRLKSAWALDLITIDPLDGKPLNFNVKAMRDRAVKLLDRDRLLLLIACPICGPFASINTNYDKVDSQDVKDTLEAAMRIRIGTGLKQCRAGRLFMHEHPTSASSWGTAMVKQMIDLEGVYTSKFDFCQLRMTTTGPDGRPALALKRTTVLTNSVNISEVLRHA